MKYSTPINRTYTRDRPIDLSDFPNQRNIAPTDRERLLPALGFKCTLRQEAVVQHSTLALHLFHDLTVSSPDGPASA